MSIPRTAARRIDVSTAMDPRGARALNNWFSLAEAARNQIDRAFAAAAPDDQGECALAIVATAMMMESYVYLHAPNYVPAHLLGAFDKLEIRERLKLLPRLAGRAIKDADAYEQHGCHALIDELFRLRNRVVHGNVSKWDPAKTTPTDVRRLWNAMLDVIETLEVVARFRIPASRLSDFRAEVAGLRV